MNVQTFFTAIVVASVAPLPPAAHARPKTVAIIPVSSASEGDEDDGDDNDDDDADEDDSDEMIGTARVSAPTDTTVQAASDCAGSASLHCEENVADSIANTAEEPSEIGAGAQLDIVSRYLWRGRALSAGPVFQPSTWASYADLTVELWANVLLREERPQHRISAVDPEVSYAYRWGRLEIEPSLVGYWSRDEARTSSTAEAGLKLAYAWASFAVVTAQSVDIDARPGAYFATLGFELREKWGPLRMRAFTDLGAANAIFNQAHWAQRASLLDLTELGVELRCAVMGGVYLTSHAEASTLLAASLRRSSPEPTLLGAGVGVGAEF